MTLAKTDQNQKNDVTEPIIVVCDAEVTTPETDVTPFNPSCSDALDASVVSIEDLIPDNPLNDPHLNP